MKHNRIINTLRTDKYFNRKQFSEAFDLTRLVFDNIFNDQSFFSRGEIDQIISMHADGTSFKEIADFYDVDEQTIKALYTFAKEILESCLLVVAIDEYHQNMPKINIQLSFECANNEGEEEELVFKKIYKLILNNEKTDKLIYNTKAKTRNNVNYPLPY